MRISKPLTISFSAFIALCMTLSLAGCGGASAKAIDMHRCDSAHTIGLIKSELPFMAPSDNGMDATDPSNVLSLIAAGFESSSSASEKGATDDAYVVLENAVKSMQKSFAKNINGKFASWQDYYDAQTVVANDLMSAIDEFGKACEKAGAGDAFRNGTNG